MVLLLYYSVVGAFHTQDQGIPSSGGHQSMSQQPSGQGAGFGRQPQSFYSSRAVPRGGPRNARGAMNGYRGPSNGFRGAFCWHSLYICLRVCHYNNTLLMTSSSMGIKVMAPNKRSKLMHCSGSSCIAAFYGFVGGA